MTIIYYQGYKRNLYEIMSKWDSEKNNIYIKVKHDQKLTSSTNILGKTHAYN